MYNLVVAPPQAQIAGAVMIILGIGLYLLGKYIRARNRSKTSVPDTTVQQKCVYYYYKYYLYLQYNIHLLLLLLKYTLYKKTGYPC